MKKEIKNYLHLYVGQQVKTSDWLPKEKSERILISVDVDTLQSRVAFYKPTENECTDSMALWFPTKDIKPILRPLSDMTDEEFYEAILLHWGDIEVIQQSIHSVKRTKEFKQANKFGTSIPYSGFDKDGTHKLTATFSTNSLNPDQFLYLLKQGFDLFNLIPEGLAIDKTKLS